MEETATVIYKGKTKTQYKFETVPIDAIFQEGEGAVFCVLKLNKSGEHDKIFLGETNDLDRYFNPLCRFTFTEHYRANAICIHRDDNPFTRKKKLYDLRKENTTIYKGYPTQSGNNDSALKEVTWEVTNIAVTSRQLRQSL